MNIDAAITRFHQLETKLAQLIQDRNNLEVEVTNYKAVLGAIPLSLPNNTKKISPALWIKWAKSELGYDAK